MGTRGTKQKVITEIQYAEGAPDPSPWLDDLAKKEYRRVVAIMSETTGALQQVDMATLETYAQSYADFARLTEEIRKEGEVLKANNTVYTQANPKCALRQAAMKQCLSASAKLGFNPVDRKRASSKTMGKKHNPLDEF